MATSRYAMVSVLRPSASRDKPFANSLASNLHATMHRPVRVIRDCKLAQTLDTLLHARATRDADAPVSSRRQMLSHALIISFLVPAVAAAQASPGPDVPSQLPKSYVSFARRLLSALRDSMEADLSPANETEVRRKAEPAKKLVKEWVQNWRDVSSLARETSYKRITESLQLLGDFYLKKGQRARLPRELGSRILRLLDEASAALPV